MVKYFTEGWVHRRRQEDSLCVRLGRISVASDQVKKRQLLLMRTLSILLLPFLFVIPLTTRIHKEKEVKEGLGKERDSELPRFSTINL